jgi:hypothetical protein
VLPVVTGASYSLSQYETGCLSNSFAVCSCHGGVICRSGKILGWAADRKSWTHSVFFAWNAVVQQQGHISVGDGVAVVEAATA